MLGIMALWREIFIWEPFTSESLKTRQCFIIKLTLRWVTDYILKVFNWWLILSHGHSRYSSSTATPPYLYNSLDGCWLLRHAILLSHPTLLSSSNNVQADCMPDGGLLPFSGKEVSLPYSLSIYSLGFVLFCHEMKLVVVNLARVVRSSNTRLFYDAKMMLF